MVSIEGILQDLFFHAKAWKRIIIGGILCYLLLGFGYLRSLSKTTNDSGMLELPPFVANKNFFRLTLSSLPLGAFYFLVPLMLAYGTDNLLRLVHLELLSPLPWGAAWVSSLSMCAVALVRVPDDDERFFLGLEFEDVLADWWRLKRVWAWPSLGCWGLVAAAGVPFYGLTFFVSSALLVTTLRLDPRTHGQRPPRLKNL